MKIEQIAKCTSGGVHSHSIWAYCTMLCGGGLYPTNCTRLSAFEKSGFK